jgi:predicted nuclease of predicted toxin-antitoxin system
VIALLVDENFNADILNGLRRRDPGLDIVHVNEVGLAATPDPTILDWAAAQNRVLLTHDRRTIPPFAYSRVAAGQPMPGVFLVDGDLAIGRAIEELLLAVHCLSAEECKDIVKYFPM